MFKKIFTKRVCLFNKNEMNKKVDLIFMKLNLIKINLLKRNKLPIIKKVSQN